MRAHACRLRATNRRGSERQGQRPIAALAACRIARSFFGVRPVHRESSRCFGASSRATSSCRSGTRLAGCGRAHPACRRRERRQMAPFRCDGGVDHVVVGDDVAAVVEDEARARRRRARVDRSIEDWARTPSPYDARRTRARSSLARGCCAVADQSEQHEQNAYAGHERVLLEVCQRLDRAGGWRAA